MSSCDECSAPSTQLLRCSTCDQVLCSSCDVRIHAGGTRKSHVRGPLPSPAQVLAKKLGQRPDQATLVQSNILKAPLEVSPVIQAKSAELQRKRLSDSLSQHISHRNSFGATPGSPDLSYGNSNGNGNGNSSYGYNSSVSTNGGPVLTTSAYMMPQIASQARTEETMLAEADAIIADFKLEMDNLNKDFTRICAGCKKDLFKTDKTIEALGRKFHLPCFVCEECKRPLLNEVYIEHAGKVYCEKDHRRVFAVVCGKCNHPINGKMVQSLGVWYHPEHFCCNKCSCQLTESTHVVYQNAAFCRGCFASEVAPKCPSCQSPVLTGGIEALGQRWCNNCFVCQVCRSPFSGQFYQIDNVPLCETHFHARNRSLCHNCSKPIVGECFQALGHSYHPGCFKCVTCQVQLQGRFYEHAGKPYCETHVATAAERKL